MVSQSKTAQHVRFSNSHPTTHFSEKQSLLDLLDAGMFTSLGLLSPSQYMTAPPPLHEPPHEPRRPRYTLPTFAATHVRLLKQECSPCPLTHLVLTHSHLFRSRSLSVSISVTLSARPFSPRITHAMLQRVSIALGTDDLAEAFTNGVYCSWLLAASRSSRSHDAELDSGQWMAAVEQHENNVARREQLQRGSTNSRSGKVAIRAS